MCLCVCLLIIDSYSWNPGAVPGPRGQCLAHRSNAVHCCWMNVKGIQDPLWSSSFLLSRYTLCCSPPWSWFPVWMPFFSSNLENPTHSLVFGLLSPSLWSLPWHSLHPIRISFFSFGLPRYFACICLYYAWLTILLSTSLALVLLSSWRNSLPSPEVRYSNVPNSGQWNASQGDMPSPAEGPVFCSPECWALCKDRGPQDQIHLDKISLPKANEPSGKLHEQGFFTVLSH